jgi:Lrp/AsnC family transcriptional regulator, leucine-responsive regulatory protein
MPQLDRIDVQLLALLQESGRISQHDLAKAVGLSAPAVAERLRKLEDRGIIRRFTALLDAKKLGWDITAFIIVGMAGSKYYQEFRERAEETPQVVECHSITGQGSHLLKIRAENTAALEGMLSEIQSWPGVQWTTTSLVLSTVKESSSTPLPPAETEGDRDADDDGPGAAGLLHVPFRHHS